MGKFPHQVKENSTKIKKQHLNIKSPASCIAFCDIRFIIIYLELAHCLHIFLCKEINENSKTSYRK